METLIDSKELDKILAELNSWAGIKVSESIKANSIYYLNKWLEMQRGNKFKRKGYKG